MLAMERASEGIYPDIESQDKLHWKSKTGVLATQQERLMSSILFKIFWAPVLDIYNSIPTGI